MQILNLSTTSTQDIIQIAIKTLQSGNLVVYPTETCYGIGVDATNPKAIKKLLAFKGNRQGKAISIAVWESEENAIANEQSGYYQEQVDRFKDIFAAPPVREGYEIVAKG